MTWNSALQDIEYNPQRNTAYWQTRPVAVLKRTLEIGMLLLSMPLAKLDSHGPQYT